MSNLLYKILYWCLSLCLYLQITKIRLSQLHTSCYLPNNAPGTNPRKKFVRSGKIIRILKSESATLKKACLYFGHVIFFFFRILTPALIKTFDISYLLQYTHKATANMPTVDTGTSISVAVPFQKTTAPVLQNWNRYRNQ